MKDPGFLRLVATAVVDGRTYRGSAPPALRRRDPADANQSAGLRCFWEGERARLASCPRRQVDAITRLRHGRRRLLAGQPAERRADRGHEPAVWHSVYAASGGEISGDARRARRRRSAVPRACRRSPAAASSRSKLASTAFRSSSRRRCTTAWPRWPERLSRRSGSTRASGITTAVSTRGHCAPTIS